MPRDTTQLADAPPDLTTPTLAGLAWLLRHKEAWPEGFEWDFGDCWSCGMGLAALLWDACAIDLRLSLSARQAIIWDIPRDEAYRIFLAGARAESHQIFFAGAHAESHQIFFAGAHDPALVTPEMVADRIDAHLARSGM